MNTRPCSCAFIQLTVKHGVETAHGNLLKIETMLLWEWFGYFYPSMSLTYFFTEWMKRKTRSNKLIKIIYYKIAKFS